MDSSHRTASGSTNFLAEVKSWLHRWSGIENLLPTRRSFVSAADAFSLNGGLSVLVVNDNPSHLRTASDALEQCGFSALLASDGAEAVHLGCVGALLDVNG